MSKKLWVVAIQSKKIPLDLELSTAISRCLQQLGFSASVVSDGDPKAFAADVIIFLTNHGNFPLYRQQLKHNRAPRPTTILWQLDPLPPENISPEAEAVGLQATRWKDRLRLYQAADGMPRWKKLCTLFRLREWANKQVSAFGFRKTSRLIARDGGEAIDWTQIRGVMGNWRAIRDAHDEGWLDHFVVSTHQRFRFLASRKIAAHFIPVGTYEEMGRELNRPRDIKVGFLGVIKHGRRAQLLEELRERLHAKGITLTQMVQGCYGDQRCEWLNRTRILVSLHNYSWNPAWIRLLIAAKCGALVVTEPMNDEHPLQAGVHYVAATLAEMPEVIEQLLDDPDKISQLANAASKFCNEELTLLRAVEKICGLVGEK